MIDYILLLWQRQLLAAEGLEQRKANLQMSLASRAKTLARVTRAALTRFNRILAEADYEDDMVFHVRDPASFRRSAAERRTFDPKKPTE
jgi:hypothetical protein